jgi:hypothetical protein
MAVIKWTWVGDLAFPHIEIKYPETTAMKVNKRQSNKPKGKEAEPFGISVIAWSNDLAVHNSHFGISFEAAPWYGYPDIDPVIILPSDGCKNLGEAYNLGASAPSTRLGYSCTRMSCFRTARWASSCGHSYVLARA